MRKLLTKKFFERPALEVARGLLGKFLCRSSMCHVVCFMIYEVEAYDGFRDKASHARSGVTKRNFPMFGEAGRWYVYFTYGMHWMLNIIIGPKDYPAAVLIRGIADFSSRRLSRHGYFSAEKFLVLAPSRSQGLVRRLPKSLLNGPAKLTKFLKIDKHFNGASANWRTGLWIEDRGVKIPTKFIKRTPRIGVGYAQEWAKKKYRFIIEE